MKRFISRFIGILFVFFLTTCTKDKFGDPVTSGYPKEVAAIMVGKCATAGCHNTQSSGNANGLDFSTWDNMFKGGKSGSSVIPYSIDYSFMLYFVNTDTSLGLVAAPTMPFNSTTLTKNEYFTLRNWIANGAPDDKGIVKFSDNPNRKKVYVCMSACDQVAVFDAETRVIMRYVPVGVSTSPTPEAPHQIRISPDGKLWAVVFFNGNVIQFFNTSDDSHVADINIGTDSWNGIAFTHDSKKVFVSALGPNGVKEIDLTNFSVQSLGYPNSHGLYVTKDDSFLYITNQPGNMYYKVHLDDYSHDDFSIAGQPHEIAFTDDESKYFISCQNTNHVRVYRASDDSPQAVINVGEFPQEFSFSKKHPYLFVTCTNDITTLNPGSVYVINYQTNQVIDSLPSDAHPHGIAVDDDHDLVYVANINGASASSHHPAACAGVNGYVSIIDLKTFPLKPLSVTLSDGSSYVYRSEVLPFPYFVTYRK